MWVFISKFPFIENRVVFKPEDYTTIIVNGKPLTTAQRETIRIAKNVLSREQIPLNKIRFVFDRTFEYDVDTDTVNPKYKRLVPKIQSKKIHPIEIGKPENIMEIHLGLYDFDYIKDVVKSSKMGVVMMLMRGSEGAGITHDVLMANLDGAIAMFKEFQ
jgi:hypothetical protein